MVYFTKKKKVDGNSVEWCGILKASVSMRCPLSMLVRIMQFQLYILNGKLIVRKKERKKIKSNWQSVHKN